MTDFSVSVLLEDDLEKKVSRNTEYKFIKEINGFDKEVNALARAGFRFLSGRRVGMIKYALMAKLSDEAVSYNFIDQNKYELELPETYQPGDVFHGTLSGDADCDAKVTTGAKLVFEQGKNTDSKKPEYRYFHLTSAKNDEPTDAALAAVRKFLADDYQLKDVFYSDGVVIIFAK